MTKTRIFLLAATVTAIAAPATAAVPAGRPDTTFSRDGAAFADFGGVEAAVAIAPSPGGKVVAAGYTGRSDKKGKWTSLDIAIARFRADGSLDRTFSSDGKTRIDLGAFERVSAIHVATDGTIAVLATRSSSASVCCDSLQVLRLTAKGVLDRSFGDDGSVELDFIPVYDDDAAQHPARMLIQRDGRIVVGGTINKTVVVPDRATVSVNKIVLARLQRDGSIDRTFGVGGVSVSGRGIRDSLAGMTQSPDGSIMLAATTESARGNAITVSRLTANGILDVTFGLAGETTMAAAPGSSFTATSMSRDPSGAIVVAGELRSACFFFCSTSPFVARFAASGTPDARFGVAGLARLPYDARANDVAVAKGRIVVTTSDIGCFLWWCEKGPQVVRLTAKGAVDRSFGSSGAARIPVNFEYLNAMTVSGDRILVAGRGGSRRDCWFIECLFTSYVYEMDLGVGRIVA